MDHSYKTKKIILLVCWTVAVLFFFVGALVISEQRKTNAPKPDSVIDNETFSTENVSPNSPNETQAPNQTETPTDSSLDSESGTSSPESSFEDTQNNVTPPNVIVPQGPPPKFESPDYSNFDSVLKKTDDVGQDYINRMVFLGDSRTYGLGYYGAVSRNQIWTPSNGTLTLSLVNSVLIVYPETSQPMSVKDAVALKKPEILVISLGINGISFMNERSFKGTFDALIYNIRSVSPDTSIILQAMYPTSPSYRNWYSINNEKIIRGNQWMLETAQKNGVYFLDAYNILADENGNMAAGLHNGDWLHPNAAGYQKIVQYIRTHPLPKFAPPEPEAPPPEETNAPPETTSSPTEQTTTPPEQTTAPQEETTSPPEQTTSPSEPTTEDTTGIIQ